MSKGGRNPSGLGALALSSLMAAALGCWSDRAFADVSAPVDPVVSMARQLEAAFNAGTPQAANAVFDTDALVDRIESGIDAPQALRDAFRNKLTQDGFPTALVKGSAPGYKFHFLRVRLINGETRALFRFLPARAGVDYLDWVVGTDAQGRQKFVDMFSLALGELKSQTMRRFYLGSVAYANRGLLAKLTGRDADFLANQEAIQHMSQDIKAGTYSDVIVLYKSLPKSLQEEKWVLEMRITAANKLWSRNPQELTDAVTYYEILFPNDPSLDLIRLDELVRTERFDEAHRAVDRINNFVGGDAYQLYMHGELYEDAGGDQNMAAAVKSFHDAIAMDPTLSKAYWGLVALSLKTKDYDMTSATLDEIEQNLHIRIRNLEGQPLYAEFVKSDAYQKWKAAHDAKWGGSHSLPDTNLNSN